MACRRMRRWISDDLDRVLGPSKMKKLESHLAGCPACRHYRRDLAALQTEAERWARSDVPEEIGQATLARLARAIEAEPASGRVRTTILRRHWAWAAAACLLAGGVGLYSILAPVRTVPEMVPTSFEDNWTSIAGRLDENPDLAGVFASTLRDSLAEPLREFQTEVVPLFDRHALFLEDLSDEEVRLMNAEIAREIAE